MTTGTKVLIETLVLLPILIITLYVFSKHVQGVLERASDEFRKTQKTNSYKKIIRKVKRNEQNTSRNKD